MSRLKWISIFYMWNNTSSHREIYLCACFFENSTSLFLTFLSHRRFHKYISLPQRVNILSVFSCLWREEERGCHPFPDNKPRKLGKLKILSASGEDQPYYHYWEPGNSFMYAWKISGIMIYIIFTILYIHIHIFFISVMYSVSPTP